MFTGIVRLGRVESIEMQGASGRITVTPDRPWEEPIVLGDSIAVNGACLTVAALDGQKLSFDVLTETFDKTNLGEKSAGSIVNLERALVMGDTLGGHIVTGHVDGAGTVRKITPVDRDFKFEVECSKDMLMLMVYKGSISIDGISLTVAKVNLEADILGKHVQRILEFGGGQNYSVQL